MLGLCCIKYRYEHDHTGRVIRVYHQAIDNQNGIIGDVIGVITAVAVGGALLRKFYKTLKKADDGVEFTADLSKSKAKSRSGHRNAGNKQLHEKMRDNSKFRKKMEKRLGDDVYARTSTSGKGRKNPKDYEWAHNTNDKNKLDLRSKENHAKKTANDPNRAGGWSKYWKNNKDNN